MHVCDVLPEEKDASAIGTEEAVGKLEQNAFANPGWAEENARSCGSKGERDVVKDRRSVEGESDAREGQDGSGLHLRRRVRGRR